jgi:hypothetical protein
LMCKVGDTTQDIGPCGIKVLVLII